VSSVQPTQTNQTVANVVVDSSNLPSQSKSDKRRPCFK